MKRAHTGHSFLLILPTRKPSAAKRENINMVLLEQEAGDTEGFQFSSLSAGWRLLPPAGLESHGQLQFLPCDQKRPQEAMQEPIFITATSLMIVCLSSRTEGYCLCSFYYIAGPVCLNQTNLPGLTLFPISHCSCHALSYLDPAHHT